MKKTDITPTLVAGLVASQFPQWADLPVVPVDLNGWDNTTFRLGSTMSVRLPSDDVYVAQVDKEHQWLSRLGPSLPLPIPDPLAKGAPGNGFPRPWSIYRWLDGASATPARVSNVVAFAEDLGRFLGALYACDATGGPAAGAHSHGRGGPVTAWDASTRRSLEGLEAVVDVDGARAVWDAAVAAPTSGPPVWVHGDVTGSNLLVRDGRLVAVIDFGCCAIGDPACDTTIAWTFFTGESRERFKELLPFDHATWARGRGWALWKALLDLAQPERALTASTRFGWRTDPQAIVDDLIVDHLDR